MWWLPIIHTMAYVFVVSGHPAPGSRYSRDGRVLKGHERALTKSKYEEDVLIGRKGSLWAFLLRPVSFWSGPYWAYGI